MSLPLAAGLSILCASSAPARAERAIVVELAEPAPFDAAELTAAMRMRLPADGSPVRVRVTRTADGVRIDAAPGSRDISLNGLAGPAAARMVALVASDLLLADLAVAPELVVRAESRRRAPLSLGFAATAAAWDGLLGGGSIDLGMPRGGYVVAVEVGGAGLAGGPVDLLSGVVRADVGLPIGAFELRAGLTLAPIFVRTGVTDFTVLAGGNASARVRIPVTRASHAVLAIGADVFATRTQYVLGAMQLMSTPRIAPWFTAGMELAL